MHKQQCFQQWQEHQSRKKNHTGEGPEAVSTATAAAANMATSQGSKILIGGTEVA